MKAKSTMPRSVMSTTRSREDVDVAGERQEAVLAVVEPDGLLAAQRDVGRIDLELHKEDEALPRADVAELERHAPAVARLAHRARLDRVDRHPLGPARSEHEVGVLDVLPRGDVEARLVEEASAQPCRSVDLERGGRPDQQMRVRPLTEDVEEGDPRK